MAKLKTKILLEMINDIITEYPNINDFMQQKLIEKCDREGISIDEVSFLVSLEAKHFSHKANMLYLRSAYAISRFKGVICFIKRRFSVYQKGGLVYVH